MDITLHLNNTNGKLESITIDNGKNKVDCNLTHEPQQEIDDILNVTVKTFILDHTRHFAEVLGISPETSITALVNDSKPLHDIIVEVCKTISAYDIEIDTYSYNLVITEVYNLIKVKYGITERQLDLMVYSELENGEY